jgi:hypothetical protein
MGEGTLLVQFYRQTCLYMLVLVTFVTWTHLFVGYHFIVFKLATEFVLSQFSHRLFGHHVWVQLQDERHCKRQSVPIVKLCATCKNCKCVCNRNSECDMSRNSELSSSHTFLHLGMVYISEAMLCCNTSTCLQDWECSTWYEIILCITHTFARLGIVFIAAFSSSRNGVYLGSNVML